MKRFILRSTIIGLLFVLGLTGCTNSSVSGWLKPTSTALPPTLTPTLAATSTLAPTATPQPTATITPTATPQLRTIPAGEVEAPILLFHHIVTDGQPGNYDVTADKFEEQMQWLFDHGYQTITATQLANLIRYGGDIPERPVVITFDDGNLDNFKNAYPILKKFGFAATFYVVESYINGQDMVTTDQLKELIQNGWEIGCHSHSHKDLTAPGVDLELEIRRAKLNMEDKLGVEVNSFAFPFGKANKDVWRLTSAYQFTSAMGLGSSYVHNSNTLYYLSRIEIKNDYSMEKFISLLPWN
jgi:peptidoglycan/xylan/chitin deacetylase (PgdA/CDA1 family)